MPKTAKNRKPSRNPSSKKSNSLLIDKLFTSLNPYYLVDICKAGPSNYKHICNDESFWENRTNEDFNIYYVVSVPWKEIYRRLVYEKVSIYSIIIDGVDVGNGYQQKDERFAHQLDIALENLTDKNLDQYDGQISLYDQNGNMLKSEKISQFEKSIYKNPNIKVVEIQTFNH